MAAATPAKSRGGGIVAIAIHRLLSARPGFRKLIDLCVVDADEHVTSLGVALTEATVRLAYNADFVCEAPIDDVVAVLEHALLHIVLGHLELDRGRYSDDWARTVAVEVAANEAVQTPTLPTSALRAAMWSKLHKEEGAEAHYARLRPQRGSGTTIRRPTRTIDDHRYWDSQQQDLQRLSLAPRLKDAIATCGSFDDTPTSDGLTSKPNGTVAGQRSSNLTVELPQHTAPVLPWRRIIRRFAKTRATFKPSLQRPSRRLPELVGVVPGRVSDAVRPSVFAIIDTSESMTDDLLGRISEELAAIARHATVTVAEADVQVQRVYTFDGPIRTVRGRGGTDLRPALRAGLLHQVRADLVVYFTDGCGPAPELAPRVPVLWCLTPGGRRPTDWGHVVKMHGDHRCDRRPSKPGRH